MTDLKAPSGHRISVRSLRGGHAAAVVIAPGFFQSKETGTFRRLERDLSRSFDIDSMDFRGHGRSGGLYTFSAKEAEDLGTVVRYVREDHARVGVLGFSYGGSIAILEAAQNGGIDSLVCVGSPMDSREIDLRWWTAEAIKLGIRGLERGAGVRPGNPFLPKKPAIHAVDRLTCPIFFIHGENDPTVGYRHSVQMHARARSEKELWLVPGASHAEDIYRQMPGEFIDRVSAWFAKTLCSPAHSQKV